MKKLFLSTLVVLSILIDFNTVLASESIFAQQTSTASNYGAILGKTANNYASFYQSFVTPSSGNIYLSHIELSLKIANPTPTDNVLITVCSDTPYTSSNRYVCNNIIATSTFSNWSAYNTSTYTFQTISTYSPPILLNNNATYYFIMSDQNSYSTSYNMTVPGASGTTPKNFYAVTYNGGLSSGKDATYQIYKDDNYPPASTSTAEIVYTQKNQKIIIIISAISIFLLLALLLLRL